MEGLPIQCFQWQLLVVRCPASVRHGFGMHHHRRVRANQGGPGNVERVSVEVIAAIVDGGHLEVPRQHDPIAERVARADRMIVGGELGRAGFALSMINQPLACGDGQQHRHDHQTGGRMPGAWLCVP